MHVLGFKVINDPFSIGTYHVHSSNLRNYTKKETIGLPWGVSIPSKIPWGNFPTALNISLPRIYKHTRGFRELHFNDNDILREYVEG